LGTKDRKKGSEKRIKKKRILAILEVCFLAAGNVDKLFCLLEKFTL